MKSVLSGIRVVEQGTFITGPCAGMMLADLGADVVKVESPDGRSVSLLPGRAVLAALPGLQPQQAQHRARSERRRPIARSSTTLIASADVYIQNFRPGTAERLGAGRQRLQDLNPKLVYCSISGFGASGPYADRPSYDSVAQALSGFLSVVVDPERPRFLGPALADAITGIYAAYGVLGALFERSRTGRGRLVEVSMLEAMAHFAVEPFAAFFALDRAPTVERSAAARAGLHPAHRGRRPDRDSSLVAREVLGRAGQRAGRAADRQRRALPHAPGPHRQLRSARRRARRAVLASSAAALGRAARRERRAVRADQSHRRGRAGSAGAASRPGRAGRACARRQAGRAPGRAVRRRARYGRDDRAAARRARRRHPPRARCAARAGRRSQSA